MQLEVPPEAQLAAQLAVQLAVQLEVLPQVEEVKVQQGEAAALPLVAWAQVAAMAASLLVA